MSRARVAVALAVLAALCLVGTAGLAVATYLGAGAPPSAASRLVVTDPASGARFAVPRAGWQRSAGVSYGEARVDRAVLLRPGYCRARPQGSFRALAGFTDQPFETWVRGVADGPAPSVGARREPVTLADGTPATMWSVGLVLEGDACSDGAVEVAMVRAGGVRVVVVADTGDGSGTLGHRDVRRIAQSLELP